MLVLSFLSMIVCDLRALADDKGNASFPPSFKAQMRVRTSQFQPTAVEAQITSDTDVVLSYSNGWWRIDAIPVSSKPGVFESCMIIPEGTRYIAYPMNAALGPNGKKLTAEATACPMLFPPPGHEALFVSWLTLCPKPKLPIIDAAHMRRPVYIPGCETSILNHPRNIATYSIGYDGNFLSDLRIRNDGVGVEIVQSESGLKPEFHRFPRPFDRGFLEFEFTLLATTNYHGFAFPARAVVKRLYPAFDSKEPARLFTHVFSEIQVYAIGSLDDKMMKDGILPSEILATDMRFTNLPNSEPVNYLITDEAWRPTSDPQIAVMAEKKGQRAANQARSFQNRSSGQLVKTIFFCVMLMPIVGILVFALRRFNAKDNTNT